MLKSSVWPLFLWLFNCLIFFSRFLLHDLPQKKLSKQFLPVVFPVRSPRFGLVQSGARQTQFCSDCNRTPAATTDPGWTCLAAEEPTINKVTCKFCWYDTDTAGQLGKWLANNWHRQREKYQGGSTKIWFGVMWVHRLRHKTSWSCLFVCRDIISSNFSQSLGPLKKNKTCKCP